AAVSCTAISPSTLLTSTRSAGFWSPRRCARSKTSAASETTCTFVPPVSSPSGGASSSMRLSRGWKAGRSPTSAPRSCSCAVWRLLKALRRRDAVDVVDGVDPAHGVEDAVEVDDVAHLEHEAAESQPVAGGRDRRRQDVDVMLAQHPRDVAEEA